MLRWIQILEDTRMSLFDVITAIIIGGGCVYAIWYANRQEKLNGKKP